MRTFGENELPLTLTRPAPDIASLVMVTTFFGGFGLLCLVLAIANLPDKRVLVLLFPAAMGIGMAVFLGLRMRPSRRVESSLKIDSNGVSYAGPDETIDIPWANMASVGVTGLVATSPANIVSIWLTPSATNARAAVRGQYSSPEVVRLVAPWFGPVGEYPPQEIVQLIDEARSRSAGATSHQVQRAAADVPPNRLVASASPSRDVGTFEPRWWHVGAFAIFAIAVAALAFPFRPGGPWDPGLKGYCSQLYWPEGSRRTRLVEGGTGRLGRPGNRLYEAELGSGTIDFARQNIAAAAWSAALPDGLAQASRWPHVVFHTSWAWLLPNRPLTRIIRATSGNHMGLWIFGSSSDDPHSDMYIGHPGGNSGTPFQTTFLRIRDEELALNVIKRPDRRLESFLLRLRETRPVCRVVSNL